MIERADSMAKMRSSGRTLAEIGHRFGVSRQRVHQILGSTGRVPTEKMGCSPDVYEELTRIGERMVSEGVGSDRTPIRSWHTQRSNARVRGIEWRLSLEQWWSVWEASGKFDLRGRRRGQYVMCRYGDRGSYSVDNVFIATCSHNAREARGVFKSAPAG